ncbi:MAG: aminotransferase class I/II-fold pyridoxal phosphate-dependent enzyme, partial [Anaerolineaceae bacterium]|nr:aminotransferase class I/II-fold pyridoxal phosphate-dependent enzyme [Anaerolineaceae bacterium]
MRTIDLRSDTVTLPTKTMKQAMAAAQVGDDVYGEDPTINALQEKAAKLLGKEAGIFLPSGTMGNLTSLLGHCARGDEVILGNKSHVFLYEAGGISAMGGIIPHTLPNQLDGSIDLQDIKNAIREENPHFPITRLIVLENTHNRCGGVVLSKDYIEDVAAIARSNELKLHMDGARIFNAAAALDIPAADLVESVDTVTFCLSKGLCAPVGSVLCGSKEFIDRTQRIRKRLG